MCTGGLAVIIGLCILFRQHCNRQTRTTCWKSKNSIQIAHPRNDNFNNEFQDEILPLERYESIYDMIDEQNMIENIDHLQDDMHMGHDDIHIVHNEIHMGHDEMHMDRDGMHIDHDDTNMG